MDNTALDYPRLMYVERGATFELETQTHCATVRARLFFKKRDIPQSRFYHITG
jgi:hypothetical protein